MKKLMQVALVALLMPMLTLANTFKEGENYEILTADKTAKPEIVEYFSFYCPHCFRFEPIINEIKAFSKDKGFAFRKSHVDFLHAASPEIQGMLTKALVVANVMNVEDKVVPALFDYLHVKSGTITNQSDIRNIFVLQGADGDKFDSYMKSFPVVSQANLMKKDQENMSAKGYLTGVPTVIVNGKYKVKGVKSKEEYLALLEYLATLP